MNALEFATIILTLAVRYRFSVTSWGRTVKHNKDVGGDKNSRHLLFCAVDCVLDSGEDEALFLADVKRLGLKFLPEGDHIHLQTP
jgi:hypothetical protein